LISLSVTPGPFFCAKADVAVLLEDGASAPDFVAQILRPSTLGGLALYGFSAVAYIIALRKIPLSVAYPSVALSYALVALVGHFLFGETFGVKQMGGLALIIGGVGLIIHT
jgi:small multidrug resistance pump